MLLKYLEKNSYYKIILLLVKHIKVNDTSHGIYKPITSSYASATTESIFHFTKKGNVQVDRLSIGHRFKTHPIALSRDV